MKEKIENRDYLDFLEDARKDIKKHIGVADSFEFDKEKMNLKKMLLSMTKKMVNHIEKCSIERSAYSYADLCDELGDLLVYIDDLGQAGAIYNKAIGSLSLDAVQDDKVKQDKKSAIITKRDKIVDSIMLKIQNNLA